MKITKCDICKKKIDKSIYISVGGFLGNSFEVCEKCGKPVLKLLKDKKLIKSENKKDGGK